MRIYNMTCFVFLSLWLFAFLAIIVQCKELPPFLHVCHRNDPDFKTCIFKSVESLRPYLATGSAEYNIPSVEPIIIEELIKEEAGGLKVTTYDVVAHGGSNFTLIDLEMDCDEHRYVIDVNIPHLDIEAKYALDGKIVLVPIRGEGDFMANLTDLVAKTTFKAEIYEQGGEEHIRFISSKMKIKVGGGKVLLTNLFGGDKILSDIINDAVNKNLNVFVKEILPFVEKGLAVNLLKTANQIIEPYTTQQLFPN